MRKNCSSDRENLLKLEAAGREFLKNVRSLVQFIQTERSLQSLKQNTFLTYS